MFENKETHLQALGFVKDIQVRIDASPFKGYLEADTTKGGYIYINTVGSHLRCLNRRKAYSSILEEIERMADDAWEILCQQNQGDMILKYQRFLRSIDVLHRDR